MYAYSAPVRPIRRLAAVLVGLLLLAGCGAPPPTLVGTPPPLYTNTPASTETPAPTAVIPPTAGPADNAFRITQAANCRLEPDEKSAIVTNFVEGTFVPLLGRSTDNDWVRVSALDIEAECWVSEQLGDEQYYVFPGPPALSPAAPGEPVLFASANIAHCRQGPGTLYVLEGTVPAGTPLAVQARNQDGTWVWVRPEDTIRNCWVAVRQGALNGGLDDIPVYTAFVLDKTAQCREGPGAIYEVATSYTTRWIMTVQGRSADNEWILVLQPNGQRRCWFSAAIGGVDGSIEPIQIMTVVLTQTGVNCRVGPGSIYESVFTVPVDTVLNVEGRSTVGAWLYVYVPEMGGRCWVVADLGRVGPDLMSVPVVPPPDTPSPVFIMTSAGQCRAQASMGAPVLTSFAADSVLEITGLSPDYLWLYVKAPGTTYECWVIASLGQVQGAVDGLPVIQGP